MEVNLAQTGRLPSCRITVGRVVHVAVDVLLLYVTSRHRNAVDESQFRLAPCHVSVITGQQTKQLLGPESGPVLRQSTSPRREDAGQQGATGRKKSVVVGGGFLPNRWLGEIETRSLKAYLDVALVPSQGVLLAVSHLRIVKGSAQIHQQNGDF